MNGRLLSDLADHTAWIARGKHTLGDVPRDNAPRAYDGARSDPHAGQDDRAPANPHVGADFHGLQLNVRAVVEEKGRLPQGDCRIEGG